ncbi:TlpA family protein disulfide reductase [Chitinophaga barathri]|nr:TlpA family protein disulfide reductase [Chitinophaga barathri]
MGGRFWFLVIGFVMLHGDVFSQQISGGKIVGKFNNLPDGKNFYLTRVTKENVEDTVQVVSSKSGRIEFNSDLDPNGEYVFIRAELDSVNSKDWMMLILDTSIIDISGDFASWPEKVKTTSPSTNVYENYHRERRKHESAIEELVSKPNYDPEKLQELTNIALTNSIDYISKVNYSKAAPLLIYNNLRLNASQKRELFNELTSSVQISYSGIRLKQQIRMLELQSEYKVGKQIPDFMVELPNGEKKSVRKIIAGSRYTLIDFWAYWCVPCREDVPELKKAYSTFNQKGFNILSISIDPNRKAWKKALSEIDSKWNNAIDIDNISKQLFLLSAIPGYILVNSNSEIVASDIIGLKLVDESLITGIDLNGFGLRGGKLYEVIEKLLRN